MNKNNLNDFSYRKTDKFDLGYIQKFYNNLFTPIKHTTTKILEIGVSNGESIKLWRDFFPNAKVYGLDININIQRLNTEPRVIALTIDGYNTNSIELIKKLEPSGFDIIIDDGPHTLSSMQFFLKHYPNCLTSGGILVLEDIIDTSWTQELLKLIDSNKFKTKVIHMGGKALTQKLVDKWKNGLDVIIVSN